MKFIINLVKSFFGLIKKFIDFLMAGWKKYLFFVLALPMILLGFLYLAFTTSLFDSWLYPTKKDTDYNYASLQQDIHHLDQGWQQWFREQFYFTTQGSPIIPLDIAQALESPGSSSQLIFGDAGTVITEFGYLPFPSTSDRGGKKKENLNPNGLPIGFTVESYDSPNKIKLGGIGGGGKAEMLGVNCAACHTSNISYKGKSIRIDGGAALGDFMGLIGSIDASLLETLGDTGKFNRLATRMDATTDNAKKSLRNRLGITSAHRQAWQKRNGNTAFAHGPARVDAFGIIFNQAVGLGLHQDQKQPAGNIITPAAPVSYPVLWDTPFMSHVQWNGIGDNTKSGGALGRNFGQVLGVFGEVEVTTQNFLPGYCSSVRRDNLLRINFWLESLNSPKWQDPEIESILPPLDENKVDKGKKIYKGKCASCHDAKSVDDEWRTKKANKKNVGDIPIKMICPKTVGTDMAMVDLGVRGIKDISGAAHSGPLAGQSWKTPQGEGTDPVIPARTAYVPLLGDIVAGSIVGSFQTVSCDGILSKTTIRESLGGFKSIKQRLGNKRTARDKHVSAGVSLGSDDYNDENDGPNSETPKEQVREGEFAYACKVDGDAELDFLNRQKNLYKVYAYKARPLNGVWASAPYLHNGSIPTLYDMLLNRADPHTGCAFDECRPAMFTVGSQKFDPEKVGFKSGPNDGSHMFDTSLPGNLNTGHEFGTRLSREDRMALIEYLKTL